MWWAKSTTTKLVPSMVITIPRRMSVALIIMAVRGAPGKLRLDRRHEPASGARRPLDRGSLTRNYPNHAVLTRPFARRGSAARRRGVRVAPVVAIGIAGRASARDARLGRARRGESAHSRHSSRPISQGASGTIDLIRRSLLQCPNFRGANEFFVRDALRDGRERRCDAGSEARGEAGVRGSAERTGPAAGSGRGAGRTGGRQRMATDIRLKEMLPALTDRIVETYEECGGVNHLGHSPLPSYREIVEVLGDLREILYPGYGRRQNLHMGNVGYHVGDLIDGLHDRLTVQIALRPAARLQGEGPGDRLRGRGPADRDPPAGVDPRPAQDARRGRPRGVRRRPGGQEPRRDPLLLSRRLGHHRLPDRARAVPAGGPAHPPDDDRILRTARRASTSTPAPRSAAASSSITGRASSSARRRPSATASRSTRG